MPETAEEAMVPNPPTSEDLERACYQILFASRHSAQPLIDRMNGADAVVGLLKVAIARHPEAEGTFHNIVIRAIGIGILAERSRRHHES
jgi:hypothetical protein